VSSPNQDDALHRLLSTQNGDDGVLRTIPLPSSNVGGFTKDIFGPLIQALSCAKKLDMAVVLF
jgi:hypothetical protein